MKLQLSVRMVENVAVVDLAGHFTLGEGCLLFHDTVKELFESGHRHILLSLTGLTYIDSSALGELTTCYITASRLGGQVRILNPRGRVHDMLEITRLFTVFVSFTDEAEAIRSFRL